MARLEPIHLKSSSAGIEVIRGTVYAEGYRVWNYDTQAWDEISVTSSGGSVGSATGDYLPLSGGTVTGLTYYTDGLSGNSISGVFIGDGSQLTGIITGTGTYLPLTGGQLTGGLTGTSAHFSGVLTAQTIQTLALYSPSNTNLYLGPVSYPSGYYTNILGDVHIGGSGILYGTSAYFTNGLSANSISANSATGFADETTIGYTSGGKLEVISVPYTSIVYPFGLDSLTFTTTPSSAAFRFTEANATTGNGTFTSVNVSWNLDDNYEVSGNGVDALSASFYGSSYDWTSDVSESAYTSVISPPAAGKIFSDLVIACSGGDQDNILQTGSYDSLYFNTRCQVGDTTHYDWGESNNPHETAASTKRFVLPSYALTSNSTAARTKTDIINAGNPTLDVYYRGSYSTYSPTYNDDSQNVYIWFIVPDSHCDTNALIYQFTAIGSWQIVSTTYMGTLSIGGVDHSFTYKMFRTTNLQSPDSYNENYRLYW